MFTLHADRGPHPSWPASACETLLGFGLRIASLPARDASVAVERAPVDELRTGDGPRGGNSYATNTEATEGGCAQRRRQ